MISKNTFAKPVAAWAITPTSTTRQIASGPREISYLKLVSVSGSAHVSLYDNAQGSATDLVWVLDASLQTNDTDAFPNPLYFSKGIYAVCDDGFNLNPYLCVAYLPDKV